IFSIGRIMTEFSHILGLLEPWVHEYGAVAIFLILTLESFGVPLPGESLLIVAAILAGRGEISFPALLVSAWIGAVTGDNIGYLIGRKLGHKALLRFGGMVGLTADRLRKMEAIFVRYGALTVAFARFFNILRQLNGVVAGSLEMDWRRFLVFNALGGAFWVVVWTIAGFYLGKHGADIAAVVHKLGLFGVIFVSVALLIVLIYMFLLRKPL
ncbi:MAG TPA: DedA family protein, partial [Sedimentisphaerales bacterium]